MPVVKKFQTPYFLKQLTVMTKNVERMHEWVYIWYDSNTSLECTFDLAMEVNNASTVANEEGWTMSKNTKNSKNYFTWGRIMCWMLIVH